MLSPRHPVKRFALDDAGVARVHGRGGRVHRVGQPSFCFGTVERDKAQGYRLAATLLDFPL
jgi:hypothetical protein